MLDGLRYEGRALHLFSKSAALKCTRVGTIIPKRVRFLSPSPDAVVMEDNITYSHVIDVKTPANLNRILEHEVVVPPQYSYQLQLPMFVTGAPKGVLLYYDKFADYLKKTFTLQKDLECHKALLHYAQVFRNGMNSLEKDSFKTKMCTAIYLDLKTELSPQKEFNNASPRKASSELPCSARYKEQSTVTECHAVAQKDISTSLYPMRTVPTSPLKRGECNSRIVVHYSKKCDCSITAKVSHWRAHDHLLPKEAQSITERNDLVNSLNRRLLRDVADEIRSYVGQGKGFREYGPSFYDRLHQTISHLLIVLLFPISKHSTA